jgi:hypothetical protein
MTTLPNEMPGAARLVLRRSRSIVLLQRLNSEQSNKNNRIAPKCGGEAADGCVSLTGSD